MKKVFYLAAILFAGAITGCRTTGDNAAAIEGDYVRVDDPNITLMMKNGHYRQGSNSINAEGDYTAKKIGEGKYRLNFVYHGKLEGAKGMMIFRQDGDYVFTQEEGEGPEAKFKRQ